MSLETSVQVGALFLGEGSSVMLFLWIQMQRQQFLHSRNTKDLLFLPLLKVKGEEKILLWRTGKSQGDRHCPPPRMEKCLLK